MNYLNHAEISKKTDLLLNQLYITVIENLEPCYWMILIIYVFAISDQPQNLQILDPNISVGPLFYIVTERLGNIEDMRFQQNQKF